MLLLNLLMYALIIPKTVILHLEKIPNGITHTGISFDNKFNITVGGTNMLGVDSAGIHSSLNVYSGTSGQFRNYAGIWKATTGTTGNGFNFTSADLSDLLTISSTGDSVFKGDITINNTSSGNQLTIQSPVPDIQFIDSQATSRKARIS